MTYDAFSSARTALVAHPSADLYGSDRVLLETISGLVGRGIDVVMTVPAEGPLVAEAEARGATVLISSTPVLRKAFLSPIGLLRLAVESLRGLFVSIALLRKVRPDLIYVNTVTIPLWPVVARLTRTPSLIHIHEAEGTASRLVRRLLATPLLLATSLVTNSRFSVEVLASSFPRLAAQCEIIPNGVPGPDSFVPARLELEGRLCLLYIGRLSHRKGPDLVIEAVAKLKARSIPANLHIVGAVFPGNEDFETGIRRRVEDLALTDHVHFHGFQRDVWPFLSAADVVIVPSRVDEPFGNTAVEAMLAARPAVISDTSGLREAAAGFESVLRVDPGSADAIQEAVAAIASNWSSYRLAAERDAGLARRRNGINAYRSAIVAKVEALAARRQR